MARVHGLLIRNTIRMHVEYLIRINGGLAILVSLFFHFSVVRLQSGFSPNGRLALSTQFTNLKLTANPTPIYINLSYVD